MAETSREKRRQQWRQRIAEQKRSGLSARRFCKEQGLGEHSFYWWRKRLGKQEAVRFAIVDRGPGRQAASLELVLSGGELLRISAGVDAVTLRTVLETLRA
jgi:DNA repair ATPase RecN